MKKKFLLIIFFLILFIVIGLILKNYHGKYIYEIDPSEATFNINNPEQSSQTLKVLVIEINPLLYTITNSSLYPNNNGHPKVSEFFNQSYDEKAALDEVIKDINESSHNYLNVSIVKKEWLNEFPTYTSLVKLKNGTSAYRFDEETYLKYSKYDGSQKGNWYNLIETNIFSQVEPYSFDYEYLFDKFNLINRRNNNEFDQVWLLSIDPTQTFETNMVGNSPFWVNGDTYEKNCKNFLLFNISISRRDSNFHALGHGIEGIMNQLYGPSTITSYTTPTGILQNGVNINTVNDYSSLNLWEKFSLSKYSNIGNYSSVGNVHFPFNAKNAYDYTNTDKVYSNWREWLNYPNINGIFTLENNKAWELNAGNDKLDSKQNKDPGRLYMRFWFYLMPHLTGYTEDGYLNNWWKYLYSLDYIKSINNNISTTINAYVGEYIPVNYTLIYNSGNSKLQTFVKQGNNIQIENTDVLNFRDGYLYARNVGTSRVTIYYDGHSISYYVIVKKK